jgi:hypothetical protein
MPYTAQTHASRFVTQGDYFYKCCSSSSGELTEPNVINALLTPCDRQERKIDLYYQSILIFSNMLLNYCFNKLRESGPLKCPKP